MQRGNNRLPCFLDDENRARYRQLLREALLASDCRLHAYVLMDNHVHLLVTPPRAGAIGQLMQRLGRQYVAQFNARHGRTGTLWEGRYKACVVDTTDDLLRCARYIDLNPVRARMTDDPTAFAWSSCAGLCNPPLPATATRLWPRRLPRDGRSQDPTVRRGEAGVSAGQVIGTGYVNLTPVFRPRFPLSY